MIKKFAMLAALMLLVSACAPALAAPDAKLTVVCTTFPSYDWMKQIIGERAGEVDLQLLQDSGIDLHNFQPTAQDFVKVSSADLFVYIGGPSDHWVEDALKTATNPRQQSLNLMEALGEAVKQAVSVEGMQESEHHHGHDHDHDHADHDHDDHAHDDHDHDKDHGHDHDHDHDHDKDHGHEHDHDHDDHAHEHNHADEHIWLSLRNAALLVQALADKMAALDPEHSETYSKNAAAYQAQLKELDQAYTEAVAKVKEPTLLFGDRFPFRYLMDDYGIQYYAAFAGCSAESEASFQTIAFLAEKLDELKLKAVLYLDGSDERIAKAVVRTTDGRDQQLLRLNAMQSLNREDIEQGANYLDIMRQNLETIQQAL